MLIIDDLCLTFGTKKVLDGISLTISNGSIAFFLGSSGVGKSTLLRVLNTLHTPQRGSVCLDNEQLTLKKGVYNQHIGMVFQHFNLFDHLSVHDNITLALTVKQYCTPQQASKVAHGLLERYGLADKHNYYPSELSGGQKQRVGLARSLALNPKVLCLDEPTSALDPQLSRQIAQHITLLAQQGYIILIASHDVALLDYLQCTIHLMHEGRIIQSASSEEFSQNPAHYSAIHDFIKQH